VCTGPHEANDKVIQQINTNLTFLDAVSGACPSGYQLLTIETLSDVKTLRAVIGSG
jgi:hypothetical protein